MFNPKAFDIREVIKQTVNREAEIEWGKSTEVTPIPPQPNFKIERDAYGWMNFFKNILINNVKQLTP